MSVVRAGLDVLLEEKIDLVRGRHVGVVTNHSAVTSGLVHIVDALRSAQVDIRALFAPEHGVRGEARAGQEVTNSTDARTGIPVQSLYGRTKKPTPEMLSGLDAVIFDIQDIGCRFYTFIHTMSNVMQACAENNVPFIILDRPNPISGLAVEGNILEEEYASFVGLHPIPIRHGMTVGELARFLNGEFGFAADLEVVTCANWKRSMYFDETGLPWVMPSSNMPTPLTALVYPGTCFFEGTNVSEGRGTASPFELFGAPWIDAYALVHNLNGLNLPGVGFRPAFFVPATSKYADQLCSGAQIHVLDRKKFEPVRVGLNVVRTINRMYPESFQFNTPGSRGRLFFDLLAGTDKTRLSLQSDKPVDKLVETWQSSLNAFLNVREHYLMYD